MEERSIFQTQLIEFFVHQMTTNQNDCAEKLELFLRDQSQYKLFILKGYAGTGKTSLLGAFVKTLSHYKVKTVLLAPTGKAAKVLSLIASKPAYTIHKQIYRRKSKLDDFNQIERMPNLFKNTVFIVDEASMIGDFTANKDGSINARNLLDDLIEYVYSGKNCSLIFLGDVGQLPPVGAVDSPALNPDYLRVHFPSLTIYESNLLEVVRQELGSEILRNATQLRSSDDIILEHSNHGDLTHIGGDQLQDELESSFSNYGAEETILITRSNKRANLYNNQIRARIFWYEEALCNGDKLMVVKNNYHWLADQTEIGFIANGETMVIKRLIREESYYGFNFARVNVIFPDYESLGEQEVVIHMETLQVEAPNLSRTRMKELFFEVEKDYLYEANKKKRYELILKDQYFNALQVKFAYAITCHKSQGGQWENVFIDPGYIGEDGTTEDYRRWLYTAITRAKSKVFLVNFPEDQLSEVNSPIL